MLRYNLYVYDNNIQKLTNVSKKNGCTITNLGDFEAVYGCENKTFISSTHLMTRKR